MKLEQALELASKHVHGCILCGSGQISYIGSFLHDDPALVNSPSGKHRVAFYGICHKCSKDRKAQQRIEAKLMEFRPRK